MFGDAVRAALPGMRANAESLMTLTLAVFEPAGQSKDGDGYTVQNYTPHGTVAGKAQAHAAQGRDVATRYLRIGEVERPVLEGGLQIPISATVPKSGKQRGQGWEYEVVAAGEEDDPALVGMRYLVVEVPVKSYATARRLDVVEVS